MLERVLHEIDSVMVNTRDLASHIKGTVTIGALPSISTKLIPSTIAEFQKRYPGIVVRLRDAMSQHLMRLIKEEEVDFGIGTMRIPDPDIQFTPLLTDHLGVIFPTGHPVERQRTVTLQYLTAFPIILMDPRSSVRDLVDRAFDSIGVVVIPAFEALYLSTAVALVQAGLGLTIQPSLEKTWSCYQAEAEACGACESCRLRRRGFRESGERDPIPIGPPGEVRKRCLAAPGRGW